MDQNLYLSCSIEIIMEIINICNCATFLGGYSPILQEKTTDFILQYILNFLQLSFIIYNLGVEKKRKINTKHQINFHENIKKLLKIDPEYPLNELFLPHILKNGQLVGTIRLLSNLVHINERAQSHFEENLQYFRIILSLTHESEEQITMKNWAVIFIKNVSERSEIMRG